ncbi:MAG: hypothetical protein RH949_27825 [Coleofasciculus sp. A1-SPW-01]|nr:hypothetical protein [Coleofasciculus chthonoplastes]
MQTLGKAALWVLSVLFILIGLLFFTTNVSAALMALLIGVVLLPPMVGFIDHPAFKIVRWGIAGMAFGLFVTFMRSLSPNTPVIYKRWNYCPSSIL